MPGPETKRRRHRHSTEEWSAMRQTIKLIYLDEGKTACQLQSILKREFNFVVCLRTLKDWMHAQGISKNESHDDSRKLYLFRQIRFIRQGKTTVFLKGDRVINDAKIDNWAAKNAADLDIAQYLDAATPEGFTVTTPVPTPPDINIESKEYEALHEVFVSERRMQTVCGQVLDSIELHEPDRHAHQIAVIGLQITSETFTGHSATLLHESLLLARDLITTMLIPTSQGSEIYVSPRPIPKTRVPKVSITYTGCSESDLHPTLQSRAVSLLQGSKTCVQLLQFGPVDAQLWKRAWYAMTLEEKSSADRLCSSFFAPLSSFDTAIAYMHIIVLLKSTDEPKETVVARFSLGIDTRPSPDCARCQRRVVCVDSMSEKGAVRVNVPLEAAWQGRWEPQHFHTEETSETARWADHTYALRGWFIKIPSSHSTKGWIAHRKEGRFWDPMDANTVLKVFQPHEVVKPMGCCNYNHVDCVCKCGTRFDRTFSANSTAERVFNVSSKDYRVFNINPPDKKIFCI